MGDVFTREPKSFYTRIMGRKHGDASKRPEWKSWREAVRRCHDPRCKDYPRYGGRGIYVYARWQKLDGFWRFFEHIGPRPSAQHTIGRIDNARGYRPGNVRWETALEQQNNRSDTRLITVSDETRSAADWAREMGLPRQTVTNRLARGWHPTAAALGRKGESKAAAHARCVVEPLHTLLHASDEAGKGVF